MAQAAKDRVSTKRVNIEQNLSGNVGLDKLCDGGSGNKACPENNVDEE